MNRVRRTAAALLVPFVLIAGTAHASQPHIVADPVVRFAPNDQRLPARASTDMDADMAARGYRASPDIGLLRAWDVGGNAQVGVGNFTVSEIARPRTNIERYRDPTSVRSRERRITGLGLSMRF